MVVQVVILYYQKPGTSKQIDKDFVSQFHTSLNKQLRFWFDSQIKTEVTDQSKWNLSVLRFSSTNKKQNNKKDPISKHLAKSNANEGLVLGPIYQSSEAEQVSLINQ